MVETRAQEPEMTLPAMLARRARHASDGRLVLDAVSGLVVSALGIFFRPPAWPVVVSAAACVMAFGSWGIIDRVLADGRTRPRASWALRALRVGAAGLGILSALALVATTMAVMLGTWIS
jgi:hypothetical protein